MSLFRLEPNPTTRQLHQFGAIGASLLLLTGWWQRDSVVAAVALAACALIGAACTIWIPVSLKRPFVWLSAALLPIGLVVGEIVLAAVYFFIFAPVAIVFRVMGRDALQRSLDADAATYWQDSAEPSTAASYFRQY
jgi:hypothetical protein